MWLIAPKFQNFGNHSLIVFCIPMQTGGLGCQKYRFSTWMQVILSSPCNSYPGSHWKITVSPGSLPSPFLVPFMGTPGSRQAVATEPIREREKKKKSAFLPMFVIFHSSNLVTLQIQNFFTPKILSNHSKIYGKQYGFYNSFYFIAYFFSVESI